MCEHFTDALPEERLLQRCCTRLGPRESAVKVCSHYDYKSFYGFLTDARLSVHTELRNVPKRDAPILVWKVMYHFRIESAGGIASGIVLDKTASILTLKLLNDEKEYWWSASAHATGYQPQHGGVWSSYGADRHDPALVRR